ncbi:hypothetical protein V493_02242 [Pseudogymnoascus sp. VKM F-4281 (FW-2241)]|nr:hypothetical protein V493_02242 [Pseudogymnoascus sp. VKM F-4281 (FW-2241)]
MQFTQTLVVLLLPILAISSPTPSNVADKITAVESRDSNNLDAVGTGRVTIDLNALSALRQQLYDAYGQIDSISAQVLQVSNSVMNQWNGAASKGFQATLNEYQKDQGSANSALLKLAQAVGARADSYKESEETNSHRFSEES